MDDERKGMDNFPGYIFDPKKPDLFPAFIIIIIIGSTWAWQAEFF